jgi:hypothetical protein
MIDWIALGFNALWILGLGFGLSAFGLAYFLSARHHIGFLQALRMRTCLILVGLGLIFFCIGLAGGSFVAWKRIVWLVLGIIFALWIWLQMKNGKA